LYGTKAGEFHKLYPASTDTEAKLMAANAVRDAGWPALAAWQWAKEQSSQGQAPVFVYEFARVQPFNPAVEIADLPKDWRVRFDITRDIGTTWLRSQQSTLFRVPSAVAPETANFLFNPRHPSAREFHIAEILLYPFDRRLKE